MGFILYLYGWSGHALLQPGRIDDVELAIDSRYGADAGCLISEVCDTT